ncbi:MAG: hypothetical protein M3O35_19985 [Acidobacteriota bacterium]|nr:hypothetical protein [Acidobacteriota bacterium]
MLANRWCLVLFLLPMVLRGQQKSDLQQILERLERLEQENHNLAAEVRLLREELASSRTATVPAETSAAAPIDERLAVQERRIDEQAQTKVEASQRLPITLTGMVLFNAYLNGRSNGGQEYPVAASAPSGNALVGGATLRQSVIGLKFQGPTVWGGGQINGSLYLDLFAGSTSSLNHLVRLRVATIEIDWKNRSLMVGQDKPIVAPREPNSLAQVGVSPLTGAGNLWLWEPQIRYEERISLGRQAGLRLQAGVYQTSDPSYISRGGDSTAIVPGPRPALEGRFEFWRQIGESARIEIAPGFHTSSSHIAGVSVPSHLFTLDWLIQPISKIQLTGAFFHGQNAAGIGGLHQGFTVFDDNRVIRPIGATGGWAQLSYLATKRLSFNLQGGQESDRGRDLLANDIQRNLMYAANAIYRLGPNVLLGVEASQVRTNYFLGPSRLNNHYDVALGYLF